MNSLLSFALLLVLQLNSIYASTLLAKTERQALVDLYQATSGHQWYRRDNWLQEDPCVNNWRGIKCGTDQQGKPTITEM